MARDRRRYREAETRLRTTQSPSPSSLGERKIGFDAGPSYSPQPLFQPGYFSPGKIFKGGSTAELELVQAMLRDAIQSYQKFAFAKRGRAARVYREAEEWLFTDDWRWPFSFLNVCEILDLSPAYIRTGLRLWRGRARPGDTYESSPYYDPVASSYKPLRMIHRRRPGGTLLKSEGPGAVSTERFRRVREK